LTKRVYLEGYGWGGGGGETGDKPHQYRGMQVRRNSINFTTEKTLNVRGTLRTFHLLVVSLRRTRKLQEANVLEKKKRYPMRDTLKKQKPVRKAQEPKRQVMEGRSVEKGVFISVSEGTHSKQKRVKDSSKGP